MYFVFCNKTVSCEGWRSLPSEREPSEIRRESRWVGASANKAGVKVSDGNLIITQVLTTTTWARLQPHQKTRIDRLPSLPPFAASRLTLRSVSASHFSRHGDTLRNRCTTFARIHTRGQPMLSAHAPPPTDTQFQTFSRDEEELSRDISAIQNGEESEKEDGPILRERHLTGRPTFAKTSNRTTCI